MDTWYNPHCPTCGKVNWVSNGDISDLTVEDVEGFMCWSCEQSWQFPEEIDGELIATDESFDFGLQTPK